LFHNHRKYRKHDNEINHCALQDGDTLLASARETHIDEQDDDESVSESHLTTESPKVVLQNQTHKNKKDSSKKREKFRAITIKDERTVNNRVRFIIVIFFLQVFLLFSF